MDLGFQTALDQGHAGCEGRCGEYRGGVVGKGVLGFGGVPGRGGLGQDGCWVAAGDVQARVSEFRCVWEAGWPGDWWCVRRGVLHFERS